MATNKNVVKFRRGIHLNIGVVIFAIIIIYVIFNIFAYFTSGTIAEYEVTQGTIAANYVYKGLALRSETVYYAEQSGFINYYVRGGARVSVKDVIYSIDTEGRIAQQITAAKNDGSAITPDELTKVQAEIATFSDSFDRTRFSSVYNFKNDLNSELSQTLTTAALSNLGDSVAQAKNTFYQVSPKTTGIVQYAIDGMESKSSDNFSLDDFNAANYQKTNLDVNERVNAADPVFKLIDSEDWSVLLHINEELAGQLENMKTIKIRFCLDGYTTYASSTLIKRGGEFYLQLSFSNAMIRYATERYLDIELILGTKNGLKIPNSAITEKSFFTIPKEYFAKGNDSGSNGVLVNQTIDGKTVPVFVTPTIYYESEGAYYVDSEELAEGDTLTRSDSTETYRVGTDKGSLKGVYNINKGYAVFKQINILYQNKEYSIVETRTAYGIALYDHIALDGSSVTENQFVVK